ncbi:cytoskeletal protein RodZ [Bacillus mesophilus]|uniref:DUF1510 family protein n=1 Tax=Bacillus mesophilus TaxID=1808955 RepID=A0A6M0Q5W3_9BACI|nr:YrrS family protein [Bacillus mesophilus]MBM7660729.1 cytoskeletal protein RodZ [Bacillus mesophilus]NEY71725.1 DUF1510 family protein [Bacillus mesophilus]
MRVKLEDLYEGPRYEKRAKNRKYNKLLNICIVLVLSLILFFTYKLIFGGNDEAEMTATEETQVSTEDSGVAGDQDLEDSTESAEASETTDTSETTESTETSETTDATSEEEEETDETNTVVENSEDPNVLQTLISNSWQPVGTEQVEPHVASYDSTSVDWQEMLRALEQATDLTESEWTLWRLGNNGSEHSAKAVLSSKDKTAVYQVYIEWVTNEGWKPVKLEILQEVPGEVNGGAEEEETTTSDEESND